VENIDFGHMNIKTLVQLLRLNQVRG